MSVNVSNNTIVNGVVNRPIIGDGLQLYVDFANLRTYPKSGTSIFDLTDNDNDLTTNGPTFSSNDGGSFLFDGSNDLIYGAQSSNPYNLSKQITYEGWFRCTDTSGASDNMIVNKEDTFEAAIQSSNGYLRWAIRSNAQSWAWLGGTSSPNLRDSEWHHFAVTRTEAALESLYLDGTFLTSEQRTDSPIKQVNNRINIGARGGNTTSTNSNFKGNISVIRVHNTTLTATQIRNNYLVQSPRYQ